MTASWEAFGRVFAIFIGIWAQGKAEDASTDCNFPAIYVFGDSNSDTGTAKATAFDQHYAPYGETFFQRNTGRYSDGRLMIDFIAEHLKLPYLSSYLDSLGTSYRHGASFAIGSATVLKQGKPVGPKRMSPISLDIQIQQFIELKQRAAVLYDRVKDSGEQSKLPLQEDFSKALYVFDIGQNDLTVVMWGNETSDQIQFTLQDIANQMALAVRNIYDQGGRSFWIHNTGPLGCLPGNVIYNPNLPVDKDMCAKSYQDIANKFNRILKERVTRLRDELPEAAITHVDIYAAKHGLITNAKNEGFDNPMKMCCGYHVGNNHIWCGEKQPVNGTEIFAGSCEKPMTSISWDGIHYTESANKWFAGRIVNGSLSDPPIPITQACHRQ